MTLPNLTPAQRDARANEKRQQLLTFLSTETWTDAPTVALLLDTSKSNTWRLLNAMQRDELIVHEDIPAGPRAAWRIYGITPTGIACCPAASPTAPEHQRGRLKITNLEHSLCVQRVRILAERAGWTSFIPGRMLYKKGLPVVPDAIATDPVSRRVAIEVERNVKSAKRRAEVLSGHVLAIAQTKAWQQVLYLCDARCNASRLRETYLSLDEIQTPAGTAKFTDAHRARFQFVNLSDFKG